MTQALKPLVPKFLKASSLSGLERMMEKMVLESGKIYDFYNFFVISERGKQYYCAAYKEEVDVIKKLFKKNEVKNED